MNSVGATVIIWDFENYSSIKYSSKNSLKIKSRRTKYVLLYSAD